VGQTLKITLHKVNPITHVKQEAQPLLTNCPTLVHIVFPTLHIYTIPFDALNEGIPAMGYRVHIWYGITRMARLQPGEGQVMMDSVIQAQYINVTDTQTATSP